MVRLARLHAAADRQMGARLLVRPQRGGGYVVGADDPLRPSVEIVGHVAQGSSVANAAGTTPGDANTRLRVSVDTAKIRTSALPYDVQEGDLVQLLDMTDAPTLRVSRVVPYGTDRTILFLVRTAR